MTLKQTSNALYGLSLAGHFNGEHFTKERLYAYLRAMFRGNVKRHVMQIALPDGWWYFSVVKYGNKRDSYSYDIPETRRDELYHKYMIGK